MNKKKRFFILSVSTVVAIVACCVLVLMLLGAYFIGYPYYQLSKILDPKTEKIETEYTIERGNSIEDLKVVEKEEGNVCVVYSNTEDSDYDLSGADTQICPQNYLLFQEILVDRKDIMSKESMPKDCVSMRSIGDVSFFRLKVYDIETQKYLKTIDVKKILDKYPDYQMDGFFNVVWHEGKEKLAIRMLPPDKTAYKNENRKVLLLDFDTEEVELKNLLEEGLWEDDESLKPTMDALQVWIDEKGYIVSDKYNKTKETPIHSFSTGQFNNWPGLIVMDISTNQLPKENDKLYAMFPELKDYIGVDGYTTTLILKEEVVKELFLGE